MRVVRQKCPVEFQSSHYQLATLAVALLGLASLPAGSTPMHRKWRRLSSRECWLTNIQLREVIDPLTLLIAQCFCCPCGGHVETGCMRTSLLFEIPFSREPQDLGPDPGHEWSDISILVHCPRHCIAVFGMSTTYSSKLPSPLTGYVRYSSLAS
jgi:hypothetical protein